MRTLTAATVAMTPDLDPLANRNRIAQLIRQAKREHPELRVILFGETILGWFYKPGETQAYHESIAEAIPGPSTDYVAELAQAQDVYISFGLSERAEDRLYNTQVLISPTGEIIARHRKFWIRNKVFTTGGRQLTLADVDGVKIAFLICADARSMWLRKQIRRARADVVLASLADYETSTRMNQLIGALYDAWVLVANRHGVEPPITWHGLITITDPWARLCASGMGKEQVLVHTLDVTQPSGVARSGRRVLVLLKALWICAAFGVTLGWRSLRTRLGRQHTDT